VNRSIEEVDYVITDWPRIRDLVSLFLRFQKPYTIFGHSEFDITNVMDKIELIQKEHSIPLTLNTYMIYALSRVSMMHEKSRTYKFKKKQIVFKNVDVALPILKTLPNKVKIPVVYIVKQANKKSLSEIHLELRKAGKSSLAEDKNVKFRRALVKLPIFMQAWMYAYIFRSPIRMKKLFGTIGITNIHYPGYDDPFIGYPPNIYTCQYSLANISEKFLPDENKQPVLRKVLGVAAGMDHQIMDGMCVTGMSKTMADFLREASGLDEAFVSDFKNLSAK
jgi:hypothetical protein